MKKTRSTYVSLIILIFALVFVATGCFSKKNSDTEGLVLNLRLFAFGPRSEELYLEELINSFNDSKKDDQTKVSFRVVPLPPPDQQTGEFVSGYENLLLADFAATDPPDVFYLNKGRVPNYIENKALLDLSPYLSEEYKSENQLPLNEPIYALPYYQNIQLVASFSTKNPEKTVELLSYISKNRTTKEVLAAQLASEKATKAALEGAGILDRVRDEVLYELWNNLALSYQNKEILIDEDSKHDDEFLISHEQAYGYPYMMLRRGINKDYNSQEITLIINEQYIENPTLYRNMSEALYVLVRSIHIDITDEKANEILSELGIISDSKIDLLALKNKKITKFRDYQFQALGDYVSVALRITKLN